jgi:hypothetical protein
MRRLAFFAFALAACGAPSREQESPKAAPTTERVPEPQTVQEAQAQIDRARADLERGSEVVVQGRTPGQPVEPTEPQRADTCAQPCNAIASMRRAVTALCRMTGEDDDRCRDARMTLRSSEAKLGACACR